MKKIPLLPRYFRWVGLICILIGVAVAIHSKILDSQEMSGSFYEFPLFAFWVDYPFSGGRQEFFTWTEEWNQVVTLTLGFSLLGLALVAFSRNLIEDEMIQSLRLYAWSWSIILALCYTLCITLFIYGTVFMSFYFFIPHIVIGLYLIFFYLNLYNMNRRAAHEE